MNTLVAEGVRVRSQLAETASEEQQEAESDCDVEKFDDEQNYGGFLSVHLL